VAARIEDLLDAVNGVDRTPLRGRGTNQWVNHMQCDRQTGEGKTLLVNVRQSISNAVGMRFTRGMDFVSLAFKRRL
jgi:hypothetical protein